MTGHQQALAALADAQQLLTALLLAVDRDMPAIVEQAEIVRRVVAVERGQ